MSKKVMQDPDVQSDHFGNLIQEMEVEKQNLDQNNQKESAKANDSQHVLSIENTEKEEINNKKSDKKDEETKKDAPKKTIKQKLMNAVDLFKLDLHPLTYQGDGHFSSIPGLIISLIFIGFTIFYIVFMISNYSNSGNYTYENEEDGEYTFDEQKISQQRFLSNIVKLNGEDQEILAAMTPLTSFVFGMVPFKIENIATVYGQQETSVMYDEQNLMEELFENRIWKFEFYKNDVNIALMHTKLTCDYKKFEDGPSIQTNIFGKSANKEYKVCFFEFNQRDDAQYFSINPNNVADLTSINYEQLSELVTVPLSLQDSYMVQVLSPDNLTVGSDTYKIQLVMYSDFWNTEKNEWNDQVLYDTYVIEQGKHIQHSVFYLTYLQTYTTGWFSETFFHQAWFDVFNYENPSLGQLPFSQNRADTQGIINFKFLNAKQIRTQEFTKPNIQQTITNIMATVLVVKGVFDALGKMANDKLFQKYKKDQKIDRQLDLIVVAGKSDIEQQIAKTEEKEIKNEK